MPKNKKNSELHNDADCDRLSATSSDGTDTSARHSRLTRRSYLARSETSNSKSENHGEVQKKSKIKSEIGLLENDNVNTKMPNRVSTRGKHNIPSELLQSDKKSSKQIKTPKRSNPFGMSEHELLMALDDSGGRLRKRKFNQSYQVDMKKCPVAGCDSRGHLMGKFERHFTLAACPIYHNLTPEQCRENHEAYLRIKEEQMEEAEEEKQRAHHNTRKQADVGPTPAQIK